MSESLVPATLRFHEGTPYSEAFGDLYHNANGGIEKKRHVFLGGNDLPARWAGRRRFVILETGFGLGLNFLVTLQAWRRDPARCERLHFVSIEKHPFSLPDLRTLHAGYPEVEQEAAELHARWPQLVPGAHRLEFGNAVLTLFFADVKALRDLRLAADAIYLDGFSPAKNADMWAPATLRAISRLAAPGATAATWSVAEPVRHALQETGFAVEQRAGFSTKRDMLVARNTRNGPVSQAPKERRAAVVGAGLAGAAVCERLCARGWEVDLYDRNDEPAQEASGNHAGTFHPIVTSDDSVFARLTRAGFLASLARFKEYSDVRWDPCGVLQLARDAKEEASQRAAITTLGAVPDYAQYVTREEASAHAGVPVAAAGLWFPQAGWIRPQSLVRAQLDACGSRLRTFFGKSLSAVPDAPLVILANSAEAPKLQPVPHLRLRKVRGQLTHVPANAMAAPRVVVLRGGMVLPPVEGVCVVGASFDLEDDDPLPRAESDAGNVERLERILGVKQNLPEKFDNRVAFRSVAPDRLPIVGKLADGVYGAFAYGSRGLIWAALAAELITAEVEGEPLPVEGKLVDAMHPARFARRAARRS
ncbi:MAG TPA: FAD-dependent 5-carboxymethylaminomethyl-2-thiouridine(34) oxidoreductase MnmC [Burkholderiales bacterium]|nr:FAD-dependent 5-carboxymethylaminomethyl-2-thiouridine(34) oxidoreductase MnmC [Burkholderiales bacterium]